MAQTYIIVASNREWKMLERFCNDHPEKVTDVKRVRSGVGKTNTYLTLMKIAREEKNLENVRLINIGYCGCSVASAKIYDVVEPVNFLDSDRDNTCEFTKYDLYPEVDQLSGPVLCSGSKFVTNPTIEAYFDMEGFCYSAFSREFGVPFKSYKLVSDHCSIKLYEEVNPEKMYSQFEKALLSCSWL